MVHSAVPELISIARQGDQDAKAELVSRFRDYLKLLARIHVQPLLQAKFDASDLVQETCLQAVVSFDQFRGSNERQLAAWMRQILASKGAWMARKYLGTNKRDARLERRLQADFDKSSLDMAQILADGRASPSQVAQQRERSLLLANAIAQVPPEQREVLIQHGLQGTSIADVARSMGRSEASVWKLWARGLQSLRDTARGEL